eukprot:GILI01026949.1.p1 GENE.GILI01026949.1~~GILI01026949.1.p1  ORF type:complete len:192 (-),score=46.08 GILI01026949.1:119-694(-)
MADPKALAAALAAVGTNVTGKADNGNAQKSSQTIFGACFTGDVERVVKYVQEGGCLDEGDKERMTLLHHAVCGKQMEVCKILLEGSENSTNHPIPVDAGDSSGWTALHYAADKGFTEIALVLIEAGGAAVNSKDEMRRTPLHLAANAGHVEVVKALLAKGASKALKTVVGWTPLKYAEENKFTEVVALLSA